MLYRAVDAQCDKSKCKISVINTDRRKYCIFNLVQPKMVHNLSNSVDNTFCPKLGSGAEEKTLFLEIPEFRLNSVG